jgi:chromosome segregation ATPase
VTLTPAPDNHVWQALRSAKRDAEYRAANHKQRLDTLANEIQRHSAGLEQANAAVRAVESHAESMGWTLELESDKPTLSHISGPNIGNVDMNQ